MIKTKLKEKRKRYTFKEFWEKNKASKGNLLRKVVGIYAFGFCRLILVIGLSFLILQPIFNKISLSFMPEIDLFDPTVISIPRNPTWDNYRMVAILINLKESMWTTTWLSIAVGIVQVCSSALIAYGFARFNFPLKKLWYAFVGLVILVPPQILISSLYLQFRFFDVFGIIELITGSPLNLHNSTWPYLMLCFGGMGLKGGLYIFLLRQFFESIPKELEEAAYIDGCGTFKTFTKIMLPNVTTPLMFCFLLALVFQWTDGFYTRIFLGHLELMSKYLPSMYDILAAYLTVLTGASTTPNLAYSEAISATALLVAVLPITIIYLIAQRTFVESLTSSGIKM